MDQLNRTCLLAELARDEGNKLKTYRCTAGKLSIGVGRNLDDVGLLPSELALGWSLDDIKKNGITKAQAVIMLNNDIDRTMADLDRKLPWWRKVDDVRQRVLVNMAFNLGINGLLGFKNTLRFIETRQYSRAASNMLNSLWARQVGERAGRLATLMRLGNAV